MACRCECNCRETLHIPYGEAFRLFLCHDTAEPGEDITFADIDDLGVKLSRIWTDTAPTSWQLTDNGDLIITVGENDVDPTAYAVAVTGTYQGKPWRWRGRLIFEMVTKNPDGGMEPDETGILTYYIRDVLWVETEDEVAYFITHGHADIVDGALILQETSDTKIELDDEGILTITQNHNI